jgi:thiamine kinase-like enzyme
MQLAFLYASCNFFAHLGLMCDLTVEFWQAILGVPLTGFEATVIKEGFLPSTVYRVQLESSDAVTPRSVILKCVRPPWGEDAYRGEREARVYTELVAALPIPQAARYFVHLGDAAHHSQLVLQDLNNAFVFYPETHAWTWAEAQAILRALAQLHSGGRALDIPNRPYLMSPLHTRWTPQRAREMMADLAHTDWLAARMTQAEARTERVLNELRQLEQLAAREALTLVHYDIYPPNIAFTRDAAEPEAVLIDWAAATADVAEIDLAFLFLQPYHSDRLLDWRAALRYYWDERARLTGEPYDWQERCAMFRYGQIQTLFTTLLAIHRGWEKGIREGTRLAADAADPYARFYDASLHSVLRTLQALVEDNGTP